jgi:hypothetical protein
MFYVQLLHMKVAHAAFLCLRFRFVLYRCKTVGAKDARRTLVKLTPGLIWVDSITSRDERELQMPRINFSGKCLSRVSKTFWRKKNPLTVITAWFHFTFKGALSLQIIVCLLLQSKQFWIQLPCLLLRWDICGKDTVKLDYKKTRMLTNTRL